MLNEISRRGIAKIKSMLFHAIAIYRLYVEKIWKNLIILSIITLDESNLFAEGEFDTRKTIFQLKNESRNTSRTLF